MPTHTDSQFQEFMDNLKPTNQGLDFFSDFDKIEKNVSKIKVKLCTLDALLGTDDLHASVQTIWDENPSTFQVLPILVAVREKETCVRVSLDCYKKMSEYLTSVAGVMEFLHGTGLDKVFVSKKISKLVDYVFGIETGLDTNARKNRSGKIMEHDIAQIFSANGITFNEQVSSKEIPAIKAALGSDTKIFDFVISKNGTTYLIETNFYSGGGSKLNEVARSYTDISQKVNAVSGYKFVWITDGAGWNDAESKLKEAYKAIPYVYNFTNLNEFLELVK